MSSKISKFNDSTLNQIRTELDALLAEFTQRTGVAFKIGRITYQQNTFTTKLSAAIVTSDSANVPSKYQVEQAAWKSNARMFGLNPDLLGKVVTGFGFKYTILGLIPSRRKYPVLVHDHNRGSAVTTTVDAIQRMTPAAAV